MTIVEYAVVATALVAVWAFFLRPVPSGPMWQALRSSMMDAVNKVP